MVIGIAGTNGAGKGTVVKYLVKQKGFVHYSVRKYIEKEIIRRGMPVNRNSMNIVGNDMRAKYGFDYWDNLIFEDAHKNGHENIIIESLRNLASAKKLKEQGVFIWAVDADKETRYERAVLRGSDTDKVSFEEFYAQEEREVAQTGIHDMNVHAVMAMADVTLTNNGTPEELFAQVEAALKNHE
ncbi:MAG: Uncharacterized protein G01um101456_390 [Parcubacteria group bacterium Gr01-1014_56]|nr:MAG: Uncharacterized protein G01um101456_390 [Parcubacteria group bacterium Gr01-1014_56]